MKNFKCRTWYCGKNHYGYVIGEEIDEFGHNIVEFQDECGEIIYPESEHIDRFVGYDANGKAVYEGDKLVSCSTEFTAELWAMAANDFDADSLENGIFKVALKN